MKPHLLPSLVAAVLMVPATAGGQTTYYVANTGSNTNPGTNPAAPKKNIDKAIQVASHGDTIKIAGGSYSGTFDIGYFVLDRSVSLVGSYDSSFTTQSIRLHPTVIAPGNASAQSGRQSLLSFGGSGPIQNITIDGIVFNRGEQNSYSLTEGIPPGWTGSGRLLIPPDKAPGDNATVDEPTLHIPATPVSSDITIRNCVFANGTLFGIQAAVRGGTLSILNNVFINNRFGAVEAYGTCSSGPCVNIEFAYNTVLFSTTRGYDLAADDLGIGYRIRTKATHHLHHNIFAGNQTALEHAFFVEGADIRINDNYIAASNVADMRYAPGSGNPLNLRGEQLNDLDSIVTGNIYSVPAGLMVNAGYLDALLRSYLKDGSAPPDGSFNQWRQYHGLPALAGGETSTVRFHANRYPQGELVGLFGAVSGYGAALFGGDAVPSAGYFISSVTRTPTSITLTWPAVTGWTRDVEYSETLNPASWTVIASGLAGGSYTDTHSARVSRSRGFYRCVVHPPGG